MLPNEDETRIVPYFDIGEVDLKRNWLVVAVLAVGLLVVGATSALGAKSKSNAAPKTVKFKVTCKSTVGDVPADG